jgi:peptidoglycan/xylan/chitin deacetylase (PgdA/CDA1 family)
MATLLYGYDVECGEPEITQAFIKQAIKVHESLEAPCTFFVTGQTLEKNVEALKAAAARPDLFNIESHTYSHMLLKTVCQDVDGEISIFRGGSIDALRTEIQRSVELTRELLGIEVKGLCGPYCYYRGLSDRPDILDVAHEFGIRFTRTWGRNEKDWQPTELSLQPFWYAPQGFGDVMEFPVHGWQDCIWRDINGWANTEAFVEYECGLVDQAV